jgi:hypothetical protein
MITHSDNTATDMILNEATPKKVRRFLAAIGATRTDIPDSTRALAGYLFGPSYLTITGKSCWPRQMARLCTLCSIMSRRWPHRRMTWFRFMHALCKENFFRIAKRCGNSGESCY